jgi:transposase
LYAVKVRGFRSICTILKKQVLKLFYIGIDIGKSNHEASIISEDGDLLCKSISFQNSFAGCQKLLKMLEKFDANISNSLIGLEATGHYWLSVYSYLSELGYNLKVINPIQSDSFRNMYIRQTKNDSKDSFLIAQIIRFDSANTTILSDENMLALKQLSRYRIYLVDSCSDLKRKVISLLDQVFPEYASLFSDIFGVTSTAILEKYQTPEDLLNISTTKLTNLISKMSKGRFDREKAEQIRSAAKNSFGIKYAKDAFSFQIKQLISQIKFIEDQVLELEEQIDFIMSEINSPITTITGIGNVLGAIILSEIGDISRFDMAPKLVAFAGLDVTIRQSGQFNSTHNSLSKRGSPYLRRAIWQAATVAAFKDPNLSHYYQELKNRGKHHGTAIGAVCRKLCNIIFAVLRDNAQYDPLFEQNR